MSADDGLDDGGDDDDDDNDEDYWGWEGQNLYFGRPFLPSCDINLPKSIKYHRVPKSNNMYKKEVGQSENAKCGSCTQKCICYS